MKTIKNIEELEIFIDQQKEAVNKLVEEFEYPFEMGFDGSGYNQKMRSYELAVREMNKALELHSKIFPSKTGERIHSLFQLIGIKAPEDLIQEIRKLFIIENDVKIPYSGKGVSLSPGNVAAMVDIDPENELILKQLSEQLTSLKNQFETTFKAVSFDDIRNEKDQNFEITESLVNELKEQFTIYTDTKEDLKKHLFSLNFADCLNDLQREFDIPIKSVFEIPVPPVLQSFLEYSGTNRPGGTIDAFYRPKLTLQKKFKIEISSAY